MVFSNGDERLSNVDVPKIVIDPTCIQVFEIALSYCFQRGILQ